MRIIILFLVTVHIQKYIYFYILLLLFRIILLSVNCLVFLYVKRFELGMETALYKFLLLLLLLLIPAYSEEETIY